MKSEEEAENGDKRDRSFGDDSGAERELAWAVARLQAVPLAIVGAILGGVGLFGMTAWLLLKGGEHVGAHLQLLDQYFYGYSVTWLGAFVGLFYGGAVGAASGWLIGTVYNIVVALRS